MNERAGRGVDLVVPENERRPSAGDEVELLVTVLLVVLLDDALGPFLGRVRVRSESADAKAPANGPPEQALVVDGVAVELVQVGDFVCLQVLLLNASRTTGSICSIPSTRSSRFSFPVHCVNVSSRSPS